MEIIIAKMIIMKIMNVEELSLELVKMMETRYPGMLKEHYGYADIDKEKYPGKEEIAIMEEIAKACAARGTLMEVNNHHDGLDVNGIRLAVECGAGLVISSDAHRPETIGICDNAIARIKEAGISSSLITNLREDARWN